MLIDERIYKRVEHKVKEGDCIITEDGYIYMIIQEEKSLLYKLLRLRDGSNTPRTGFVYTIVPEIYKSIDDILDDNDFINCKIISNESLKLSLI